MTINSPRYNRGGCQYEDLDSDYYYESIQINVIQSEIYTLSSIGTINAYGYLYKHHFNPHSSSERLLFYDDEGCFSNQFKITAELEFNVTYILIMTTFRSYIRGNFSILVSGSNNVTFSRISEFNIRLLTSIKFVY